ncbi:hypothetical protein ACHAWF_005230 [Thalassiosira exigua]
MEHFASEKLGKNRCKVPADRREWIYDVFLHYNKFLSEQHLFDDCDRTFALIKGIEHAKKCDASLYEKEIQRMKIYVDEVQDYTQIEILFLFCIGGSPGSLFLAGDPAQSVVEGTEFRFEEVRSVGYFVSGEDRRDLIPAKPRIVNVNFRSHAGVLNCTGAFLDLLFRYFPGSAKQLKKDFGLFNGSRPGLFQEKMPGTVVLTHDESAPRWKEILDHPLVYGIREAKGLEFKSVIILDFFADLPQSLQKPWRNLLLKREGSDFELRYPLVETHIKLVYTAVTRCIETLFFAETNSSDAGTAAVRWLASKDKHSDTGALATINNVGDLDSMVMTNDDFCAVGLDNTESTGSSEIELDQSIANLDRAIYCFDQAKNSELLNKAKVHRQSVGLRSKVIQMGSSIYEDDKEAIEEEAAI